MTDIIIKRCLFCNKSESRTKLHTHIPKCKKACTSAKAYDEITRNLLYNTVVVPVWIRLDNKTKYALCHRTKLSYSSIHDVSFFRKLDAIWKNINDTRVQYKSRPVSFECTICYECVTLDGCDKSTTLNCGHAFCSSCIFKHLKDHNSCPMCRQNAFDDAPMVRDPVRERQRTWRENQLEEKRVKRRRERKARRERAKIFKKKCESVAAEILVTHP